MKRISFFLSLTFFAAVANGCGGNQTDSTPTDPPSESGDDGPSKIEPALSFVPGSLPKVESSSCESTETTRTTCEWAGSSDAIVVGDIVAVEAFDSPAWGPDLLNPGASPEACVIIQPGLRLRVSVADWLKGETDEELTVYVGGQTLSAWSQTPQLDGETTVWSNVPNGNDPPFAVGMTVGLPIVFIEGLQKWTLYGGFAFTFTEGGVPVFDASQCAPRGPTDLGTSPTYSTFASAVGGCANEPPTTYGTNKLNRRHTDGESADLSTSAYCALPATE